jgi:3',5'-cyclic AMP phosphodiesterase CpdA
MTTLRIAHFSDTHVLAVRGSSPARFLNKRVTGAINLALNRAKHYRVEIFERLLAAISDADVDHTICTGDLVNLALEPEFDRVQGMLAEAFPDDALTLVPGNHDYYARDAVEAGLFERYFGRWQPRDIEVGEGAYPVVRLRDGLAVVGLSTGEATPVFMATGTIGDRQLGALSTILRREELKDRFVVLALHHPLLPDPSRPLDRMRRLTDADRLVSALWDARKRPPGLVIHGHNHEFLRQAVPGTGIPLIQVASGSRLHGERVAEFNVYVVEDGTLTGIERHVLDPEKLVFNARGEDGTPIKKKQAAKKKPAAGQEPGNEATAG